MKKNLILFHLLLLCTFAHAQQRPTPNQIVSLFQKTPAEVKSFLTSNGFVYKKKEEDFYTYVLPAWGNSIIVSIAFKANRLNVFSIQQSVMYYNSDIGDLYTEHFILTKSCSEDFNSPPIPVPGCISRLDNKNKKLIAFIIASGDGSNSFLINYGRL